MYAEGNRVQYHKVDKHSRTVRRTLGRLEPIKSIFANITRLEYVKVREGGGLFKLVDSELEIQNVVFNYRYSKMIKKDTLGIHMVYSDLYLRSGVEFIGPAGYFPLTGQSNEKYISSVR